MRHRAHISAGPADQGEPQCLRRVELSPVAMPVLAVGVIAAELLQTSLVP